MAMDPENISISNEKKNYYIQSLKLKLNKYFNISEKNKHN